FTGMKKAARRNRRLDSVSQRNKNLCSRSLPVGRHLEIVEKNFRTDALAVGGDTASIRVKRGGAFTVGEGILGDERPIRRFGLVAEPDLTTCYGLAVMLRHLQLEAVPLVALPFEGNRLVDP